MWFFCLLPGHCSKLQLCFDSVTSVPLLRCSSCPWEWCHPQDLCPADEYQTDFLQGCQPGHCSPAGQRFPACSPSRRGLRLQQEPLRYKPSSHSALWAQQSWELKCCRLLAPVFGNIPSLKTGKEVQSQCCSRVKNRFPQLLVSFSTKNPVSPFSSDHRLPCTCLHFRGNLCRAVILDWVSLWVRSLYELKQTENFA